MREIKFRAWDEQNKVMHNNFQFIKSGDEGNDWILFVSDKQKLKNRYKKWTTNPYFSQQLKIMQFTGLKDKNGKEIFEGDIVKTKNRKIWEIIFHGGRFIVNGNKIGQGILMLFDEPLKVIGNKFENPELIK